MPLIKTQLQKGGDISLKVTVMHPMPQYLILSLFIPLKYVKGREINRYKLNKNTTIINRAAAGFAGR
jgi:hypothetical protein